MAKRRKGKKSTNTQKLNVGLIVLLIASVILGILIYLKAGYIGKTIGPLLGGIIGWVKNILPLGLFAVAIYIACNKERYFAGKVVQYSIVLLCIAIILSVYQISVGNLNLEEEYWKVIKQAYTLGEKGIGGGAVAAMVTVPMVKLIGSLATVILAIGVAIILLVLLFDIRPAEIFAAIAERLAQRREDKAEYQKERRAERGKRFKENEDARAERAALREERREKRRAEKEEVAENPEVLEDQITINLNNNPRKEPKIYNHDNDDLEPLKKKEEAPTSIEAGLFKQEQEKKEDKTKEVLVLEHALTVEDEHYEFPPVDLMKEGEVKELKGGKKALTDIASRLQKTLFSFGVSAKVENVSVGPAITRYELKPAEGVRVSKIANLADDIALNLAAESIRIEAPIPGKQAVGIEIPNKEKQVVHLRDIIESDKFKDAKSKLAFALGKDVAGEEVVTDIAKMPHVLIAGSTGSGKSVCINTLITSIIYKAKPSEVKLVMVDPKVVELSVYNGIPHLLIPVVTDPKKAAGALSWAVQEMVNRYSLFAGKGVRDIKGYNEVLGQENENEKLPQIVIIIDELADLMMVAPNDVEDAICRLAQMARAAGMHLVIATQRPSVDVITGIIKANIPSRIAFAVSSQVDSRTILDMAGAEKLLGKGDMLFAPVGAQKPQRVQGAFIDDKEVEKIVEFLKSNGEVKYNEDILEKIDKANSTDKELDEGEEDDTDPFLMEAIETVVETGQASTSFIQRRFKVGYARAGRIMDQMEARGVISGYEGSKPRQVLLTKERLEELKMSTTPGGEVQEEGAEE